MKFAYLLLFAIATSVLASPHKLLGRRDDFEPCVVRTQPFTFQTRLLLHLLTLLTVISPLDRSNGFQSHPTALKRPRMNPNYQQTASNAELSQAPLARLMMQCSKTCVSYLYQKIAFEIWKNYKLQSRKIGRVARKICQVQLLDVLLCVFWDEEQNSIYQF